MPSKRILVVLAIGLFWSADTARGQLPSPISAPTFLNSYAVGDASDDEPPEIATDGLGLWIAVWASNEDLGGTIGTDRDLLFARSTDNGATWSAAVALNANAGSDSGVDDDPRIATDGAGTWVVAWYSNEDVGGVIHTDYDILFIRSTDNGTTWTGVQVLNTNAVTDGATRDHGVQLVTDRQGTWVATWITEDGPTSMSEEDLLVSRSEDNGISWSPPALLNLNGAADTGRDLRPHLATDRLGNWVAVWQSNEDLGGNLGTDHDIFFTRSADNGATWTLPAALNTNADTDMGGDSDPRVATDGAGHWITVWRSSLDGSLGTDGDLVFALSVDNGATWSAPAPLNSNADGDNDHDIAIDPQRGWVVVWQSYEDLGGTTGTEGDIFVSLSTDQGTTWSPPALFNTNASTDGQGYDAVPRIAADGRGQFVGVWYSDNDLAGGISMEYDILTARFGLPDCNTNFVADGVDIVEGTSEDCDGNGVPDECQPDSDANGTIDPCEPQCGVCAQGVLPAALFTLSLTIGGRRRILRRNRSRRRRI
ncbi:MAG TPA: sialidase family protein [Phycisphaerae bacterium]|nr:sialidase family protein [Phycisphaerae bacterium]